MFLDGGKLHLAFSVCSTLTGYHLELHRSWLMLRRHQLLHVLRKDDVLPVEGDLPWTVGVLLTPRPDGSRLWDTTIAATNGLPDFETGELDRLIGVFGDLGTEGNLAS